MPSLEYSKHSKNVLMNAKRTEAGLQPLTLDNTLVEVARYKSNNIYHS